LASAKSSRVRFQSTYSDETWSGFTDTWAGWDEGVPQMKLGEKALLDITRYVAPSDPLQVTMY